jgi:predicted TIM-barrel fold metal-dependent hydrolase
VKGSHSRFPFDRREFLKTVIAAAGVTALGPGSASPAIEAAGAGLIDINVNLGRWPLRRVRYDDTAELASMLRSQGVIQAWAGSFEGLLHKDIAGVNTRLAEECRRTGKGLLVPFGSVNPKLPDWKEDLRRCAEVHRMPGIRLNPNYHGYRLDDPDFLRLVRLAEERGLLVELALIMEDQRMMHPLLRVEPTDPGPLVNILKQTPGLRLVLVNALRTLRNQPLVDLINAGEVYVEISMLDGFASVANLLAKVPANRVLFGSYAPLFYFEAAPLKLQESPLDPGQLRAIRYENAERLFARA